MRKGKSARERLELIFRNGDRKLNRDLDIVNIIEMIKGYRCLRKVLFDRSQLFYLKFQRKDVLVSDSPSDNDKKNETVKQLAEKLIA